MITQEIGKAPLFRAGTLDTGGISQNGRIVRYVFSTPSIGRDMHTVAARAWQLENYLKNPVFLWHHDDHQPPIGRVVEIGDVNGVLKGNVEYAERDLNPFAETIYQLVRAGYINATSTSWQPIEWSFARDNSRPGGVDFTKVDLLEISQVPIPALPAALAEARSRGIDTAPLYEWAERLLDTQGGKILVPRTELETLRRAAKMPTASMQRAAADWKVGASRNLPIEDSDEWDGAAAEKSIFDWAGGDDFDPKKARKGFLVYDASAPEKRGSYKLPIAHAVDGRLKVPKGAIKAAASRLSQTDIPENVAKAAGEVLDHYKEKAGMKDGDKEKRATRAALLRTTMLVPTVSEPKFRGLYDVAQLAYNLQSLGYIQGNAEFEAEIEEDESQVPAMLGEALKTLGEALIAMAAEEVKELLEDIDGGEDEEAEASAEDRTFIAAGKTPRAKAWRRGIVFARAKRAAVPTVARAIGAKKTQDLQDGQGHLERAMDCHRAVERAIGPDHPAADKHEELGRCVRAASRCIRAVVGDDGEDAETEEDAGADGEEAKKQQERAAREARVQRAKQLQQNPAG